MTSTISRYLAMFYMGRCFDTPWPSSRQSVCSTNCTALVLKERNLALTAFKCMAEYIHRWFSRASYVNCNMLAGPSFATVNGLKSKSFRERLSLIYWCICSWTGGWSVWAISQRLLFTLVFLTEMTASIVRYTALRVHWSDLCLDMLPLLRPSNTIWEVLMKRGQS